MHYSAQQHNHPDAVIIFDDHENIEGIINPLLKQDLSFKTLHVDEELDALSLLMKPKVLLFAFNQVQHASQYYVKLLQAWQQEHFPHYAVLLIANKDLQKAYLTCENGLFDDYLVINPFNDKPHLVLTILKATHIINERRDQTINQLIEQGEEELAHCLTQGRQLKQAFSNQLAEYQHTIHQQTKAIDDQQLKQLINHTTDSLLVDLNQQINQQMEQLINQLSSVQQLQQNIKQHADQYQHLKTITSSDEIEQNADISPIAEQPNSSIDDSPEALAQLKVLVADNSRLFSQVVADIFLHKNLQVEIAESGSEALEKFANFQPDAVVLSLNLGNIDGIELTRRLRQKQTKRGVAIIALTHNKDRDIIRQWIAAGLNAYLVKPSSNDKIFATVLTEIHQLQNIKTPQLESTNEHITWKENYSVGNDTLDSQHQHLFEIIDQFLHTKFTNKTKIAQLLNELEQYADQHFADEERLMQQSNYPKFNEHKEYHQVFVKKLKAIKQHCLNDKLTEESLNKMGMFLYKWLTKHILHTDMAYKNYLEKI